MVVGSNNRNHYILLIHPKFSWFQSPANVLIEIENMQGEVPASNVYLRIVAMVMERKKESADNADWHS